MKGRSREDKKWLVRSVSLPVQACESGPWPDFMCLLRECWRHSTDLANWASHTLARNDVVRTPGMKELPPMPPVYLYGVAFGIKKQGLAPQYDGHEFWAGGKIAAAALLRRVERKYRQERGKTVWRRERRTPEFLYPYPFPVHQQAWAPSFDARGQPVVSMALPGGRVSLRLRRGGDFERAVNVLGRIADGEVAQQELSVCRQATHANVPSGQERLPGGGHRDSFRVMLRMAYRMEVTDPGNTLLMEARTGADPFLTLTLPGVRDWVWHSPQVRQWVAEHRRFLDAFADDLKFEKRWPAHKRRAMARRRGRGCEKHHRRMKSWMQETAHQVVGVCARQKCGRLVWDDADRSFAESLPWFRLREFVQSKCDENGIALVARGEVVGPDDDVAADVTE